MGNDPLFFNKVAGAVLTAGLIAMTVSFITNEFLYHKPSEVEARAIAIDTSAVASSGGGEEQKPSGPEPIAALLASADPAAGEAVFNKCKTCHTVEAGGPNKIGPNLHGVVGGKVAGHAGFSYSSALQELGGNWDYDKLNHFLYDPRGFASGTKMTFAGLKKPEDRAEVISYLRSMTENPPPLPEPEAEPATQEGAPAGEGQGGEGQGGEGQGGEGQGGEGEQGQGEQPSGQQEGGQQGEGQQQGTEGQQGQNTGDQAGSEQQAAAPAGAEADSFEAKVANADPEAGAKVFNKCKACHTVAEGGPNRIGPNLHGVIGRDIASLENFSYSSAFKALDGEWTYAKLDDLLADPRGFADGTKMVFPGLKKEEERAQVVAYLRQNSPTAGSN